jgi:hypothetical protein
MCGQSNDDCECVGQSNDVNLDGVNKPLEEEAVMLKLAPAFVAWCSYDKFWNAIRKRMLPLIVRWMETEGNIKM